MKQYTKTIDYNSQLSTVEPIGYGSHLISEWAFWGDGVSMVPTLPGSKAFNQTHAGNMLSENTGW